VTTAPRDLQDIRTYLIRQLDLVPGVARGSDLEANEVGIVGDPSHAATGGYHEGNDDLARVGRLNIDYSKRESSRDRPGSNAASALDIGDFDVTRAGRRITLRSLSARIDAACRRKDPRTRDVREWIWSPDGVNVIRWDALGLHSGGDSSHRYHSHASFFRDSEGRRGRLDNFLGLLREIIEGLPEEDAMWLVWGPDGKLYKATLGGVLQEMPVTDEYPASRHAADAKAVWGAGFKGVYNDQSKPVGNLDVFGSLPTTAEVEVDATAVAEALAKDTALLAAIARAVNDDAARRGAE
jgi:hypothetical protein